MCLARNEKGGKNEQKPFCPSTKTPLERFRTIMVVRYKKIVFDVKFIDFE